MNDVFLELYRQNNWANQKLVEFCHDLPSGTWDREETVLGTRGSIRDTLVHMSQSQEGYLGIFGRWSEPQLESFPGWEELAQRFRRSGEVYEAIVAELSGEDEEREALTPNGRVVHVRISAPLTQVLHHSTDHRSQIATILTQLGSPPPEFDAWAYAQASGHMRFD